MRTTVCTVFESRVSESPDSPALLFGDGGFLSYRDLNARANRLAHYLMSCGVTRGDLVGVLLEPSVEAIVAFLAILKAGGAYVPFDTASPEKRLASLIADAGIGIVLTRKHLANPIHATGAEPIYLEEVDEKLAPESIAPPDAGSGPDDLAYVMFTSGSTGIPKGVCIAHRGIVRLVRDVEYVSLSSAEVLLQSAPITFDAATFEIWGALLNGGKIALPPTGFDLKNIGALITQYEVTTLWLTARLFDAIVDDMIDNLRPLRQLLFGGEQASLRHVEKAFRELPNCKLINGYGPTENTTFTCTHTVTASDFDRGTIPIGRPISKTRVYILDDNFHPVTDGNEGELYIAGDGLALGYLNRPDLTAEKFLTDVQGEPLVYRSGDRVRMGTDGNIECLGRRDSQVKIRGYRIELGEIEAQLLKFPGILQAAAIAVETPSGSKSLAAYYRHVHGKEPQKDQITRFIAEWLPAYMVPTHLIPLSEFPLTTNGKLDVKKLPSPYTSSEGIHEYTSAQLGDIEEKLLNIWRKALANGKISLRDNFFELGGDSLSALEVSIEIEIQLAISMPMSNLFQFPTVELLSKYLKNEGKSTQLKRSSLVPIQTAGSKPPLFCIPWKGGTSISFRAFASKLGPEQPVYGLEPIGEDGHTIPFKNIPEMATHYVEDILSVQPIGPYHICGASRGGIVAWEVARQLEERNLKVALVGLFDSPEPSFHLDAKPFEKTFKRKLTMFLRYFSLFCTAGTIILKMGTTKDFVHFSQYGTHWLAKKILSIPRPKEVVPSHDLTQYSYTPYAREQLLEGHTAKPCHARTVLFRSKYNYFRGWEKDIYLGWKPYALSGVSLQYVPGQHTGLLREPFAWILAKKIKPYLDDPSLS